MKRLIIASAAMGLMMTAAGPATQAGLILDPTAASTNMGSFTGRSPTDVINQSGLSSTYVSLSTDFATYIASDPTHNSMPTANAWFSASGTKTGDFDFTLGGTYTIQSFALWDIGGDNTNSVVNFTLLASDTPTFASTITLGSFTANPNSGTLFTSPAQVFTFTSTSAQYVRMEITSNNGGSLSGFGEAAFEVGSMAVPEPSSLILASIGGLVALAALFRGHHTHSRQ